MAATVASASRCEGEGVTLAIVRHPNTFQILAHDESGERKQAGGDEFKVDIKGKGVYPRVKTSDNGDGSYTVTWSPETTGEYVINVSLAGEKLPGCPFTCSVSTRTPHAPHCSLVGEALKRAVSREQQTVEVRFRDALGNVAHAEDLDCYVEAADQTSTVLSAATEEELELPAWLRAGQPASPRQRSPSPRLTLGDAQNCYKANVQLVVRASASVDSDRVCQLRKGRMLFVLEQRPEQPDGSVRALVAVDGEGEGEEEESWRSAYVSSSATGGRAGRSGSPRSPRRSPIGWVTIKKAGKSLVTEQRHLLATGASSTWSRGAAQGDRQDDGASIDKKKQSDGSVAAKKGGFTGLSTRWKLGAFWNEVTSDPSGVGFAFGGVEPGRLHAKGKCVEVHKLFYSIGRAGRTCSTSACATRASRCRGRPSSSRWCRRRRRSPRWCRASSASRARWASARRAAASSRCAATTSWAIGAPRAAPR